MADDTTTMDDPIMPQNTDSSHSVLPTVLHMLDNNTQHFKNDDSEYGQRLHSGFMVLKENMDKVTDLCDVVRKESKRFDFNDDTPGNGFRSFSNIVDQSILCVFDLCKQVCTNRDSLLFRKGHFVREVEAWGQTLASLVVLLDYIVEVLLPRCKNGQLLAGTTSSPDELMAMLNSVPQYSFYGRCVGFHYYPSLRKTLKYLNICLSAYSEVYYADGRNSFMQRTKNTVMTGSKYVVDAELRSRRIVDVVQYSSVDFIKTFWSVAETDLLTRLPGVVGPSLAVVQAVMVACEEQQVQRQDGTATVVIPPPHSHIPPRPISCYLLSANLREGMVGVKPGERDNKSPPVLAPSDSLIIHCHGGGFVTQSTKAQEVFLREWAVSVGVPILSIDYSLAPEAPYPRPLEEVLTVYCWALNHMSVLGSTGAKIILTGDSAGGNLIAGLTIKCLELGIRPADGLFFAYTPFAFELIPSPARLLAVMDPLLPLGFALRCLKAYAGVPSRDPSRVTTPGDPTASTPTHVSKTASAIPEATESLMKDKRGLSETSDEASLSSAKEHFADDNSHTMKGRRGLSEGSDFTDDTSQTSTRARRGTEGSDFTDTSQHSMKGKRGLSEGSDQTDDTSQTSIKARQGLSEASDITDTSQVSMRARTGVSESDTESFVEVSASDVKEAEEAMVKSPSFASEPGSDTLTTVSLTSDTSKLEDSGTRNSSRSDRRKPEEKEERSRRYVAEFLEKYVLDSRTDKQGRRVPILRTGSEDSEVEDETILYEAQNTGSGITAKLGRAKDAVVSGISAGLSSFGLRKKETASSPTSPVKPTIHTEPTSTSFKRPSLGDILRGNPGSRRSSRCSLMEEFSGVEIIKDHYLSPLTAPQSILAKFPPVAIVTVEYDFCLDDDVTMAKTLRDLGVPVTIDVLEKLPHGFLSLSMVSQHCHTGCRKAITRIRQLCGLPDVETASPLNVPNKS